jgi:hypothetical protein
MKQDAYIKYCRDSKLFSGFPRPTIFKSETKLLTEYESITQKVLLIIESKTQNAKQLQHERLSCHVRFENYRIRKRR